MESEACYPYTDETINILCATDNNYAPYCGIMLTSLFESNKDSHFNVFVFVDSDISESNKKSFLKLGRKYGHGIELKSIDESRVSGYPIRDDSNITRPTYYRLLAADLLPECVHRIIYLDCDVIVKGDIKSLWKVDLEGVAIAGVKDYYLCKFGRGWRPDTPHDYFNAGVMVLNLDFWRMNGVSRCVFDYLWENRNDKAKLYYMDQDALNAMLYNKKALLPERFNYQVGMFENDMWQYYSEDQKSVFIEEGKFISVIHYLGIKPWKTKMMGPFFYEWERIRRKSLWPHCRVRLPLKKRVKFFIKRVFFPNLMEKQRLETWYVTDEISMFPKFVGARGHLNLER